MPNSQLDRASLPRYILSLPSASRLNPQPLRRCSMSRSAVGARVCLMLLLLLSAAAPVAAQFDTATVVGTVKDASGATVPDAKVTLTNTETGVSVVRTTTNDGTYEFGTVRPGIYIVSAEKSGFALALVDNVQVQVAARLRVDLSMSIGQLSEKVVVTAASPLVD